MKTLSDMKEIVVQSRNKFQLMTKRVLEKEPSFAETTAFFLKLIRDYVIYGASITDFFEMEFYMMGHREKKDYYTYRFAKKFDYLLDSAETMKYFNSKAVEYRELTKYFNRDQLVSDCTFQEFEAFVKRHPVFFLKPDKLWSGSGIQKIDTAGKDIRTIFEKIREIGAVIDEPVIQHPAMDKLCPGSINTIRVITAKVDGVVHIMGTALRTGDGMAVVDNYFFGGFGAAVDKSTGVILGDAMNYTNRHFDEHPLTHVRFKGFQIPLWDKVLHLVDEAAHDYGLNYCGWDVAVRKDDCVLIEANVRPMIQLIQIAGNGGKKADYKRVYRLAKKQKKRR